MARQKKRADGRYKRSFTIDGARYYVYGYSKQELDEKEYQKRQAISENQERRNDPTFEQYFEKWIKEKAACTKPATVNMYQSTFKTCSEIEIDGIKFSSLKMSDITKEDVLNLQKQLRDSAMMTSSVNRITTLLKQVFQTAVDDDRMKIVKNPFNPVKVLERTEEAARNTIHRAMSAEETAAFFEAAADSYFYNFYRFAINTGMRIGEIGALYYSDIKDGMIHVERTLTKSENGNTIIGNSAKTQKGRRTIPVNDAIRECIDRQKAMHRMIHGDVVDLDKVRNDSLYNVIFRAPEGGLLVVSSVWRDMKKICKKAGIEDVTMHSLRATYATRAIEQNVNPRVLQDLLGHTSYTMTMDLYVHVLDDAKKEAMKNIIIA